MASDHTSTQMPGMPAAAEPEDRIRVLVVEDDLSLRLFTTLVLASEGYAPTGVGTVERALVRLGRGGVDLVLTDLIMLGRDGGLDLLQHMRDRGLRTPALAMTGSDDGELTGKALALGALSVLRKPFTRTALAVAVRSALDGGRQAA
jgi:CheY-like chemotaxis protein